MGYAEPTIALPLLTLDSTDVGEFDYSTFLQDQQDIDYLAEESSGSTTEPQLTPSSGTLSDAPLQVLAPRQDHLSPSTALAAQPRNHAGRDSRTSPGPQGLAKQRLERRGHTKSRRGCFNCKRRRIKVSKLRDELRGRCRTDRSHKIVSRDETCVRALRQAGSQVRVSLAPDHRASGTSSFPSQSKWKRH
jgi:hypothetical protein